MTRFTPQQAAAIHRKLNPPKRKVYANHGLEAQCREQNASYASVRAMLKNGLTREEAFEHCRERGLLYVPRGSRWWEVAR